MNLHNNIHPDVLHAALCILAALKIIPYFFGLQKVWVTWTCNRIEFVSPWRYEIEARECVSKAKPFWSEPRWFPGLWSAGKWFRRSGSRFDSEFQNLWNHLEYPEAAFPKLNLTSVHTFGFQRSWKCRKGLFQVRFYKVIAKYFERVGTITFIPMFFMSLQAFWKLSKSFPTSLDPRKSGSLEYAKGLSL